MIRGEVQMAKKKSKAKQYDEFLNALFGLAGGGSFFVTYYLTKEFVAAVIVAIVAIAIFIAILVFLRQKREERLKQSGIVEIDKMEGIQFEKYLGHLFKAQGYEVKVTKAIGDYGADLIIIKDGVKVVVQAKRYSNNVGIKAVQEAQAAIAHYGAANAWVITNSEYTEAAYELAKSNNVKLINRQALIELILSMNSGAVPLGKKFQEQVATAAQMHKHSEERLSSQELCVRCGSQLVLRKGSRGEFYGCSNFPKCRYTKQTEII